MHLFSLVYYQELCLEFTPWSRSWSCHWKPGSGSRGGAKKAGSTSLQYSLHINMSTSLRTCLRMSLFQESGAVSMIESKCKAALPSQSPLEKGGSLENSINSKHDKLFGGRSRSRSRIIYDLLLLFLCSFDCRLIDHWLIHWLSNINSIFNSLFVCWID